MDPEDPFYQHLVNSPQNFPGEIWKKFGFFREIWGKDWGVKGGEKGKRPVEVTRVKGSKKFRGKNGRVWG